MCACVHVYACACVLVRSWSSVWLRGERVATCEFVCVPAHSGESVCVYVHPFCVRTYVRACACQCLRVCVSFHVHEWCVFLHRCRVNVRECECLVCVFYSEHEHMRELER